MKYTFIIFLTNKYFKSIFKCFYCGTKIRTSRQMTVGLQRGPIGAPKGRTSSDPDGANRRRGGFTFDFSKEDPTNNPKETCLPSY